MSIQRDKFKSTIDRTKWNSDKRYKEGRKRKQTDEEQRKETENETKPPLKS